MNSPLCTQCVQRRGGGKREAKKVRTLLKNVPLAEIHFVQYGVAKNDLFNDLHDMMYSFDHNALYAIPYFKSNSHNISQIVIFGHYYFGGHRATVALGQRYIILFLNYESALIIQFIENNFI